MNDELRAYAKLRLYSHLIYSYFFLLTSVAPNLSSIRIIYTSQLYLPLCILAYANCFDVPILALYSIQ